MSTIIALIMDGIVLAALAGTIFYTMRLSKSLNNFRSSRDDLKKLILELTQNIDKAQSAMLALRKTSNDAAVDLEDLLHDSKKMAEELKLINETSDGLAGRLERLAHTNREIAETLQNAEPAPRRAERQDKETLAHAHRPADAANVEMPSFFIRDREYGAAEEPDDWGDDEGGSDQQFASKAERELFEALQKNKKSG